MSLSHSWSCDWDGQWCCRLKYSCPFLKELTDILFAVFLQHYWSTWRYAGCATSNTSSSKTWPKATACANTTSWNERNCCSVVSRAQGHTSQASRSTSSHIQGSSITSSSFQWRRVPTSWSAANIATSELRSSTSAVWRLIIFSPEVLWCCGIHMYMTSLLCAGAYVDHQTPPQSNIAPSRLASNQ